MLCSQPDQDSDRLLRMWLRHCVVLICMTNAVHAGRIEAEPHFGTSPQKSNHNQDLVVRKSTFFSLLSYSLMVFLNSIFIHPYLALSTFTTHWSTITGTFIGERKGALFNCATLPSAIHSNQGRLQTLKRPASFSLSCFRKHWSGSTCCMATSIEPQGKS